jgi:hypothetical protein
MSTCLVNSNKNTGDGYKVHANFLQHKAPRTVDFLHENTSKDQALNMQILCSKTFITTDAHPPRTVITNL